MDKGAPMRFVTFLQAGEERFGFLQGDVVVDPLSASGDPALFGSALAFIRSGDRGIKAARTILDRAPKQACIAASDVVLAAPLRPSTILCSGSNYHDHNAEKANTPISGKEPEFFVKTADCVVGPGEPIVFDALMSKKLDCETELAVVIGKPGRHIPAASALDHVFGYTIVNDVTARDRQVRRTPEGMTWYELGSGKAFDSSAPLGPCIVTADEIGDPQKLKLQSRINGELRQSSSTSNMIWTCAQLIHFFSRNFTLKPGMVIITGTPAGTAWSVDKELGGKGVTPPGLVPATRYCLPGDVVECEIEKIGVLRNPVAEAGEASAYDSARTAAE
jgi:2-keto-4-pentenoate hydratase/2-oxohepta-3-ene-1,7-dioic acid hydratase in catechol pathway